MAKRRREESAARGLVLDAGAFIGIENRRDYVVEFLALCVGTRTPLVTSAGVVSQIWRGGDGRQAPVAKILNLTDVRPLDIRTAKLVGLALGRTRTRDPVDAHVVLIAIELGWPILSSDRADLESLHEGLIIYDA